MNDIEGRAIGLIQRIKDDFFLLRYYPYLDTDRKEARELEKEIEDFLAEYNKRLLDTARDAKP